MALTEGLQAIVMQKELRLFACYDAVLEVVVVSVALMVVRCPELHKLSCSELCLVVVEEGAIGVVVCLFERFVHQYLYMEGTREYTKIRRKLMISEKVTA